MRPGAHVHPWWENEHYLHRFGSKSFEKSYTDKLLDEHDTNSLIQAC